MNSNSNLISGYANPRPQTTFFSLPFFTSSRQGEGKGAAVYLPLCNHRIWEKSFPPCRIQLASRERSSPRPTLPEPLSLPPSSITPTAIDPQWVITALLAPRARPQLAATRRQHPTPPWVSPWPPWAPQHGQRATDHRPGRHLAARLASTPWTNSPN
jgi:hypothetical protein